MIGSILADLTREISCPKTGSGAKNLSLDELEFFIVVNFVAQN
jgi:hypothetical protein